MYLVTAASHIAHFCRQVTWTLTQGLEDLIRNHSFIFYKDRRRKDTPAAVYRATVIFTIQCRKETTPEEVTDLTQGRWEAAGRRSEPAQWEWPGKCCPDMHTPWQSPSHTAAGHSSLSHLHWHTAVGSGSDSHAPEGCSVTGEDTLLVNGDTGWDLVTSSQDERLGSTERKWVEHFRG